MLEDLQVLNGNLELKFAKYNYEYTVTVEEDVTALELSFIPLDGVNVLVIDNELDDTDNIVYLKAYKDMDEELYTLYVHKNTTESVDGILKYKESLEVKKEEVELYKVQILGISIFLIIVIIFCLLFKKRNV